MTFSILTRDPKTGVLGAAAATGSLCVGGWVLKGITGSGLVASQGTSPSPIWRDKCLSMMSGGASATEVVNAFDKSDAGRSFRQLTALDRTGSTSGFTGRNSGPYANHECSKNLAVSGNMLSGPKVLEAMKDAFSTAADPIEWRLLNALKSAEDAGGDSRGLRSAALLVLDPDRPPLDLRIDYAENPVRSLTSLLMQSQTAPYSDWLDIVPTVNDPNRSPKVSSPKS